MIYDVAIAGGGPTGLAVAAQAARRGLSVVLLERGELPADKACGEGLMPAGVEALDRLGVQVPREGPEAAAPFKGIRYVQEDGAAVEGWFGEGRVGLGVRRTALSRALADLARRRGAVLVPRTSVRSQARTKDGFLLGTDQGEWRARVLVAADGLHSPLRRALGLEGAAPRVRRFGLRRHFRVAPWSPFVEVHFARDAEAYLTPCGPSRVGVAFLWEDGRLGSRATFDGLLGRFPELRDRLDGARPESLAQGAGPFWQVARARAADRFVLLGDAAGYVDALTGEGLSLGLHGAEVLAEELPEALSRGAGAESFQRYERRAAGAFARYARITRGLLLLARRPHLRRRIVRCLRTTGAFERLLRWGTAYAAPRD